jgi:hypothetical protein
MNSNLSFRARAAFGLAFDVEKTTERKSGFRPAELDLSARKRLFGDLRLDGFAAVLTSGFCEKLIVVGGLEGRYPGEAIGRATAIRRMLLDDFGLEPERVEALLSTPNTEGNIHTIKDYLRERKMTPEECALVSNHYHLPRAHVELVASGLPLQLFPAEALWLLRSATAEERRVRKGQLIVAFGEGPLAERVVEEVNGIADKIVGAYEEAPRT